jgi:hypothetical protein
MRACHVVFSFFVIAAFSFLRSTHSRKARCHRSAATIVFKFSRSPGGDIIRCIKAAIKIFPLEIIFSIVPAYHPSRAGYSVGDSQLMIHRPSLLLNLRARLTEGASRTALG